MAERKKKAKNGALTVYRIRYRGTLTGEFEYNDDGGSYELGSQPFELSEVYATKAAAEAECKKYNNDYELIAAESNAWEYEDTPFFRCDGVDDDYAARVRLPWPQLWDKCLDLDIEPPTYAINTETGAQERDDAEPDLDQLGTWWQEHVDNGPRADELKDKLLPYIILPELFEVYPHKIDAKSRAQLAIAFAANAGVADSKKLSVTLLDAHEVVVETFSGSAAEAIAKVNEFLVAHGVTQKTTGSVRFGPVPAKRGKAKQDGV